MPKTGVRLWGSESASSKRYRYVRDRNSDNQVFLYKHLNIDHIQRAVIARKLMQMKYALDLDRIPHNLSTKKLPGPFHENLLKQINDRKKSFMRARGRRKKSDTKDRAVKEKPNVQMLQSDVDLTECENMKWKKKICSVANSSEVAQVLANRRVFMAPSDGKSGLQTVLLESIITAVHKHDWALACKCVEGLAEICKRNTANGYWMLWNGGFIALCNTYKNDAERLIYFAENARTALGAYPRRLGVEVATWLTQKGNFGRGRNIMNDWHERWGKSLVFKRSRFQQNPKRHQIELIASLFEAVYSYAAWRRGLDMLADGHYLGDRMSIRRLGEMALTKFETLIELAHKADADVTMFIKPLIELTMEFKTEFVAREVFLSQVMKHERNFVLEVMYLDFLKKYFPFLEEEIELFTERQQFYNFNRHRDDENVRRVRKWKDRMKDKNASSNFKTLSPPDFSF